MCTDARIEKCEGLFDNKRVIIAAILQGILFLGLAAFVSGCTSTHIKAGRYEFSRISFCQSIDVEVVGDSDGNIKVKYSNDGGKDVAQSAAKVAGAMVVR